MSKTRILVDMDEVLAKFWDEMISRYNIDTGQNITKDMVKTWKISESLGPESEAIVIKHMKDPLFFANLEVIEGSQEYLKKLVDEKYEVRIVTAIPKQAPFSYGYKFEWMKKHFPFFDMDCFMGLQKKEEVMGHILFDDAPHNLKAFQGITVAMDRPWNQNMTVAYRVKSWKEFYINVVKELEKAQPNGQKIAKSEGQTSSAPKLG